MSIEWSRCAQALLISFLVSAVLVPLARRLALQKGIIDVPNERSSHQTPKPRIGGLAIIVGGSLGLFCSLGWPVHSAATEPITLLLVLIGLAAVGLVDDMRGLTAAVRMPLYLLGAGVAASACYRIETLSLWGEVLHFSPLLAIVITTLVVGWYTNLFNFMDGIDGIAGGTAVVTCGSLALVFGHNDAIALALLSLALAGATMGFLLYNYAPSNVFMGDAGSVFLGAACGTLSVAAIQHEYLSLPATLLLMFPFVYDASFTLARRALAGEKVWKAHRSHIYQQMGDLGISHREVTIIYMVFAVGCAYCGLHWDSWPLGLRSLVGSLVLGLSLVGTWVVLRTNRLNRRG